MWIILLLLFAGTLSGFIFSGYKNLNRISDKATLYTIYILLFFMGLSVGTKPEVMKNLAGIGLDALIIALFAIGGSIFTSYLLFRYFFSKHEK